MAAFVQRLRKTQETVSSFTKTIAFCTFKKPSVYFCFVSLSEMFLFYFSFCSETSKAGIAKPFFIGYRNANRKYKCDEETELLSHD